MQKKIFIPLSITILLPAISQAQTLSDKVYSMHHVLSELFDQMLPECSQLIGVGRALAAFAALWYIAYRVWGHIARAEPIDFYPLLRPFALGIAILLFPALISMMNSILQPVSDATYKMAHNSTEAISYYVTQEQQQVKDQPQTLAAGTGSADQWAQYEQPDDNGKSSGFLGGVSSFFHFKDMILYFINQVLQILYAAAGLAIDTIRTFYMIVLAIIGPLVLGLSVFDGFHQTLSHWISRYVHVFMWLPVANIFSAISSNVMELMIKDGGFGLNTVAYCIFMVICIVGYTAVPSVAGYIMQPGGGSRDTLLHKTNSLTRPFGFNKR